MRTPKWIALAFTPVAALALLAFAACGGDDDNKDKTTAPTGSGQSTGGATHSTAATATQASDGGDGGNATADPFAALENLTGDISQQTGKVSYNSTSESGSVSTMTLYSKPGFSRTDQTDSDGSTSSFITNAAGSFLCDSSDQTCIGYGSSAIGAGIGLGFSSLFSADTLNVYIAAAQAAGVDVAQSSETHAGIDADCFAWTDNTDPTDPGTGKLCFGGDQHILLYEEFGSSSGTTKLEATAYSGDVPDSDFDTPYPVTTTLG